MYSAFTRELVVAVPNCSLNSEWDRWFVASALFVKSLVMDGTSLEERYLKRERISVYVT